MQNNKDIRPINDKGQAHGCWKTYWSDNNLSNKCYYVNGKLFGFQHYQNYKIITELRYYAK
jgi:antitoxin component YwqK of YwqJK toxin-antitoxin module